MMLLLPLLALVVGVLVALAIRRLRDSIGAWGCIRVGVSLGILAFIVLLLATIFGPD